MKFYEIKPGKTINLEVIREVLVLDRELYITYTCGDTRTDRTVFTNAADAESAYRGICEELLAMSGG